ncbi:MAG: 3-oxoacyl-ACP reductase FabG [Bacteriovoracaceae bacterium]
MIVNYNDLENKTVLITGATRGIGRSIAKSLAAQKCHVVFNYRAGKEGQAEELKKELLDLGAPEATGLLFDLNQEQQMKDALESFIKEKGPIESLVNNAGISKDQLALRIKQEDVAQTLDTNLKSQILLTSYLTKNFMRQKNVSIINMSSVVGLMGNPSQIAYAASKSGLIGFTKSYAKEMASRNIRCNAVCPGFIQTDMTDALDPKVKEHYLSQIPLNNFGESEDVAQLVCFLLSTASKYITGEVIKIDGGLYI